jgi:chorismate synthase
MLQRLQFLTAGESHGRGLVGILEGIPAGLEIDAAYIDRQLARRQRGHGRGKRMKIEQDRAEIYSGVRHGKTLGSPIALVIPNRDWANWRRQMSIEPVAEPGREVTVPRPGHADLAGVQKFDFIDIRNVLERASARETAMRVALASICRKLLKTVGIEVGSRVVQIHQVRDDSAAPAELSPEAWSAQADTSPVRCLERDAERRMIAVIDEALERGDSVGGIFEVVADGLPYGLGTYVHWDKKLPARIAEAFLSVNAFKGVEVGTGFGQAGAWGSEVHDEILFDGTRFQRPTNRAGGMEGGMSNAQPIVVRVVMKPIPTLIKPLRSVDLQSKQPRPAHKERTDACAVPAASIIGESMLCLVLADALLEKFGGDTVEQLQAHMQASARY